MFAIPTPDVTADWPRDMLADLRVGHQWAADKALRVWIAEHRLAGAGFATTGEAPPSEAARNLGNGHRSPRGDLRAKSSKKRPQPGEAEAAY